MRVVVAGARGYIGRSLRESLESSGAVIVALTRTQENGLFRDMKLGTTAGLAQHCEGADAVVNLAGELVHDRTAGVRQYFEANVAFASDLAQAAVDAGAAILVHASSRLVYPSVLSAPAREDCDVAPDTPYGMSKSWGEDVTRVDTMGTDTSAISLRIGQVTGGEHPGLGVINSFISQAKHKGTITVHGKGSAVRDIVHIDDVVAGIGAALAYRGSWLGVNVGGTEPITIAELAALTANQAEVGRVSVVHQATENEDTSCYALDSSRSHEILGWAAARSPADILAEAWRRNST